MLQWIEISSDKCDARVYKKENIALKIAAKLSEKIWSGFDVNTDIDRQLAFSHYMEKWPFGRIYLLQNPRRRKSIWI